MSTQAQLHGEPPTGANEPQRSSPADLAQVDPGSRRRLARLIRSQKATISRRWLARHRELSHHSAGVIEALGSWEAYQAQYVDILLVVLRQAIARGRQDLVHIYISERTRYYDPGVLASGGQGELERMLQGDIEDIASLIDGDPAFAERAAAILEGIHAPLLDGDAGGGIRIAMVGDCLLTETAAFVKPHARELGIPAQIQLFYFTAWAGHEIAADEVIDGLRDLPFQIIGLSFLTFCGIPPYTALLAQADKLSTQEQDLRIEAILRILRSYTDQLRAATDATILLHGCSGLPLTRRREYLPVLPAISRSRQRVALELNERIRELCESSENMVFLDEQRCIAEVGLRRAARPLISRLLAHRGLFHPSVFGSLVAAPYVELAHSYAQLSKTKVLLVDLDNTLWEGVMAEGEVRHDVEAQRLLKRLREAGILLVAISKNDPQSIRWDELVLTPDDFVLQKVSWAPKPTSAEEVAAQLDLAPDSFVLIDDNPVERELVSKQLPAVRTMDPADPQTWRSLELMLSFPNTGMTAEAARRTDMYREAAARRDAMSGELDFAAMMQDLDLRVEFGPARKKDLDRVEELVQRTNQFNTTTIRRSRAELAQLLDSTDHEIYVGTLSDKFGDLGIVGTVIVSTLDQGELRFDSVIMSCRAMGFGMESVLVRGPLEQSDRGLAVGKIVPTERNGPCASLFQNAGFSIRDDQGEEREWVLDLEQGIPEVPPWLTVIPLR
jgi:FkbH-like protein